MAEFTLKIRRFDPESGESPYWQEFGVELEPDRSVLDGILQAKGDQDGSLGHPLLMPGRDLRLVRRAHQRQVVARLQHAPLDRLRAAQGGDGTIVVEPMGNMPVIKDLIVDMDAVHWKKVQRVTPWLLPEGDPPDREYIVEPESMIDITQSMACIHCGACVSACLSLEVDPEFVGPAALAKAYRFVGDPRDAHAEDRLLDLAYDPHGIYDCTHCFACIEVCPKDVAPMNQIMRLRRRATSDYDIRDINNGFGHEKAFVDLVETYGTLHEAQLLPRSFGEGPLVRGQTKPAAVEQLIANLPTAVRGLKSGKVSPAKALSHKKLRTRRKSGGSTRRSSRTDERLELNMYIVGESGATRTRARRNQSMKLAYWPGCVSRGFTPELHGSMAVIAPKLDLELVELERSNCCGAGVIAEHNQELADTLNARTFAMAQAVDGAAGMMNICSTCQGAQSECQERLDASSDYRPRERAPRVRGPPLPARGRLVEQEPALDPRGGDRPDKLRDAVVRPLEGLRIAPFYGCYIVRPTRRLGYDEHPERGRISTW